MLLLIEKVGFELIDVSSVLMTSPTILFFTNTVPFFNYLASSSPIIGKEIVVRTSWNFWYAIEKCPSVAKCLFNNVK